MEILKKIQIMEILKKSQEHNMKYIVIEKFKDLQDKDRIYEVGDKFPATKRKVSKERIAELSSTDNLIGKVLIELVEKKKRISSYGPSQ